MKRLTKAQRAVVEVLRGSWTLRCDGCSNPWSNWRAMHATEPGCGLSVSRTTASSLIQRAIIEPTHTVGGHTFWKLAPRSEWDLS